MPAFHPLNLGLVAFLGIQAIKIDGVNQQRGIASIAGRVGDNRTGKGEQQAGTIHEQGRVNFCRRQTIQLKGAAIGKFAVKGIFITQFGLSLQEQHHLILARAQQAGGHINADIQLGIFAQAVQQDKRRIGVVQSNTTNILRYNRDGTAASRTVA